MNKKKEDYLIAIIGLGATIVLGLIYYLISGESSIGPKSISLLKGIIPSSMVATVAFPIIYFLFKRYGFFVNQSPKILPTIDRALLQKELRNAMRIANESLSEPLNVVHDIFISSPMAGFSEDAEFEKMREDVLSVEKVLRTELDCSSVIYAGKELRKKEDFDIPKLTTPEVLGNLRASKNFLLIYPAKLTSSVLVETGIAIALDKPVVCFVKDKKDLPYILEEAESALSNFSMFTYHNANDIIRILRQYNKKLFSASK